MTFIFKELSAILFVLGKSSIIQGPVVRKVDSAIHWIVILSWVAQKA